jgi:hypothetical protein
MSGDDRGDLRDHRKNQHFYLSTANLSGGSSYGQILKSSSPIEKHGARSDLLLACRRDNIWMYCHLLICQSAVGWGIDPRMAGVRWAKSKKQGLIPFRCGMEIRFSLHPVSCLLAPLPPQIAPLAICLKLLTDPN